MAGGYYGFSEEAFKPGPGETYDSPSYKARINELASSINKWHGDGSQSNQSDPSIGNKFALQTMSYPSTLGGVADLQHSVVFHINVRGSSHYLGSYKGATLINTSDQNTVNSTNLGKNANTIGQAVGIAAGGYIGAKGAASVISNVFKKAGAAGKAIGVITGAGLGAYTLADAMTTFAPDTQYRTQGSIRLAVTEKPGVKYGVDYAAADLGAAGHLLQSGGSIADIAKSGAINSELARSVMMNVASIPSSLAGFGDPRDLANYGTGTTPNPFRAQMFKSVDNRVFSFDYKFLPRNAQESNIVKTIIYMFKFHMHPEISKGGYYYIYPSTFDIEYHFKNSMNGFINKISTCVLETMSVDYGGGGGFHTFSDGSPTEINMRLQFKELEVLTKERITAGY